MADKISIPIESRYDDKGAKAALRDAKELDKAKPEITITANAKAATRDIDGLMKKVDLLDKDAATILLTSNATKIAGDIADLIVDLDKLDANDADVQVKAAQINALKGDLDQIEAKVREVNNVPVELDTKPARKNVDDLGKSADSSKSVLANMVGNSVQDLGALGGIAGSTGVAIGQMGEYMADAKGAGDRFGQVIANFGKVAGPLAGLAAVTGLVQQFMAAAQEADKLHAEKVKTYVDAMKEGVSPMQAFIDKALEMQKIDFTAGGGGLFGIFQATNDLTPLLAKAGYDLDEFAAAVKDFGDAQDAGTDKSVEYYNAFKALGLSAQDAGKLLGAVKQEVDAQADSTAGAGDKTKVYGATMAYASQQAEKLNKAYADGANPMETYNRLQEEAGDQIDRVIGKLQEQADALNEQVDAATTAADAQRDENEQLATFSDLLGDAEASTGDVTDAAIDLAKAHQQTADAQAKATGQTITATQKLDSLNDGLLNTAATARGPARQGILDYIGSVNQIPPEKMTEIQAAIDAGDLDTAKRLLNEASAPRTAAIQADANTAAANSELNNTANPNGRPRIANITPVIGQIANAGRLTAGIGKYGGTAGPGGMIAGEAGPEFIRLPGGQQLLLNETAWVPPGSQVTSVAATERILRERETSGPVNVSINMPRGTRPEDAVRAADRYARRNGKAHARRR